MRLPALFLALCAVSCAPAAASAQTDDEHTSTALLIVTAARVCPDGTVSESLFNSAMTMWALRFGQTEQAADLLLTGTQYLQRRWDAKDRQAVCASMRRASQHDS